MKNLRKILAQEGLIARGPIELTDPSQVSDKRAVSRTRLKDFRYRGDPVFRGGKYVFKDKADRALPEDEFQEGYLGYSPKKDVFVVGYDVWLSDDGEPEYRYARIVTSSGDMEAWAVVIDFSGRV